MIKNIIICALCIVIFVNYTVERHTKSPQFTFESGEEISVLAFDNYYRLDIDYSTEHPIVTLLDIEGDIVRNVADLSEDSLLIRTITKDNE
ncbi:MAG: hypothetical protein WBH12_03815 [Sediminibacterium sp.]